jgi:hypothetical protein
MAENPKGKTTKKHKAPCPLEVPRRGNPMKPCTCKMRKVSA